MARPNKPTLLYPNGREDIIGRVIKIEWEEPLQPSNDLTQVWYEVFYSEFYDQLDEPDWKKIAVLPAGNNFFNWKIGNSIKSQRCKVAIRSVNIRGERSEFSVSADLFSLRREQPPAPAVLSPLPGARYGSSVEISFDDSAILNTFGQRAKYYIYFRSNKAGVPYTPVAQGIPPGTGPIIWDTSSLPPADDYVIVTYLADDDGNKSQETNIENVSIFNEGFFLIDTKPPTGFVQINNADQFTREEDVTVKLFAFDETTGIHAMRFIERTNTSEGEGEDIDRPAEAFAEIKYYTFDEGDGDKVLKVLFQDYGGNRTSEIQRPFRVGFERDNSIISDIVLQRTATGDVVWAAINESQPGLYRIDNSGASLILRTNEDINALALLTDTVYIAVATDDGRALIYRDSGLGPAPVIELEESQSEVISMENYSDNLYIGTVGGMLYRYDEAAVNLIQTFNAPIEKLYSDDALLYIILRNSTKIIVYDNATFTEVDLS
tara:strand:+ start:41033 stop:42505 length:1473 start_codon:yes stop_codon:yes gene_type:complete